MEHQTLETEQKASRHGSLLVSIVKHATKNQAVPVSYQSEMLFARD